MIYLGCEIISSLLIQVPAVLRIQQWILHQIFFQIAEPKQASLMYSLVELVSWSGVAFLLQKRQIAAAAKV